jgi:hypothetical protein
VSFQPEERYWTDYLRIALPLVGILLLFGLLWYWANALIGNGGDSPPATIALASITPTGTVATPAPSATPTAATVIPSPGPPPTPTANVNPTEPPVTPAPPTAETTGENPCANLPVYELNETVVTTEEVNLREGPGTESASLGILPVGTELQINDEFVEAGQCDWWPVTDVSTGRTGYVIEQFLRRPTGQ